MRGGGEIGGWLAWRRRSGAGERGGTARAGEAGEQAEGNGERRSRELGDGEKEKVGVDKKGREGERKT